LIGPLTAAASDGLIVGSPACEDLENPLGLDTLAPRLSWRLEAKARAKSQTAYQILVASSPGMLKSDHGDLWDSGKVISDETLHVAYAGKTLRSGEGCFWKVRAWDETGKVSAWSQPAQWQMGLLRPEDWQGHWIALTTNLEDRPAPLLRRSFAVEHKIKQARLYICGLGYYELHLNGAKVGNHLLDPGYTRYDKRDLYVTYDVTDAVRPGRNALGVILGNGWFNVQTRAVWNFDAAPWRAAPKVLLQLTLDYADGTTQTIATDARWRASAGPILFDSIYGGETYDARREQPGWDTAEFDDSKWADALVVPGPGGKLVAQAMPAIEAVQEISPVGLTEPKPGVFVFDMGQNFAGFAELKVRGAAGDKVVMKYGERLGQDGRLDRNDIQVHVLRRDASQQFQTDTYILKGGGEEAWHARFDYHGFQYVEVTGFPGRPKLDTLRGVFIHSAVPVTGEFTCSNPLLNQIWRASRWSYLSNLQGIPTDCPHREKNGWTGDAHLAAEQGLLNFGSAAIYTKWINDLGDEQQPTGELPGIVPTSGWGYQWGNGPAWDSAYLLIPYYLYEYCGDTRVLREHYPGLKRYVDYLTTKAKNGIVSLGLNDWAPYKTTTPADITSTAYYYRDAQIVALAASLAGQETEARQYRDLAASIRRSFNATFFHAETGLYGNGSQTSLGCALYQGMVEPANRPLVLAKLVAAIEKTGGHIDTGILGAKYVLNALLENGRADVAYRVASQKDLPSWGWWFQNGANTLWEEWNGTASRNHIMFGDISAWFYKALAGINPDPHAPGFKHFFVKPNPVAGLTFARASYDSVRGRIQSDWHLGQGKLQLSVTIPPNTTATLSLPEADPDKITEGGGPAAKTQGVKFHGVQEGWSVFELESGTYSFATPADN